ncbi:MAG: hypothetical protein HOC72_11125, partial [Rhodospirillaceae bacterium]|nr:hypothetical protein [Rhodospirillaceae bacterium]
APKVSAGVARRRSTGAAPKSLQLRVDAKTGEILTSEQLKNRDRQRAQAPRPLRAQRSDNAGAKAAAAQTAESNTEGNAGKAAAGDADAGGIQVQALDRSKVSAIGLLNVADGGFGNDMWAGTPLPLVMRMLPRLPVETTSPVMQSLRRRLLLTTALPPDDDGTGRDEDGSALIALRIERLAAAGNSEAVTQLLKFAPLSIGNKIYAQVRVEEELLAGNVRQACAIVRNRLGAGAAIGAGGSDAVWQKIMAFCLALDGQAAQVELYEQLLYENGVEDEAFFTLLAGLNGAKAAPLDSIAQTDPLHLAMLRTARRAIPADAVKQASPAVLRAIATSPNASLDMRLEAAERAEALGALPTEVLRRIYASVPFTAEQSADALALAKSQPGPSASAILYQVAQIDAQVESRARALAAAWRNGRRSGRYMTAVRVNLPIARSIKPDANLTWFALPAGRALLAAGDKAAARAWLMAAVDPARAGQPAAAAAMLDLAPLLYIRNVERNDPALLAVKEKIMAGWWQGEVAKNSAERYQRGLRLLGLLMALGKDVSGNLWLPLFEAPERDIPQVSPSLLLGLDRAAAGGRKAEVVLLSLLLLGEKGPAASDTIALGRIVSALRRTGLAEDAGALALEGLLGAGF